MKYRSEFRIEPRSCSIFDFLPGSVLAICFLKYVSHLGNERNTGIKRNGATSDPIWFAVAIPMFIQIADTQCHGFAEPHLAGNVSARAGIVFE